MKYFRLFAALFFAVAFSLWLGRAEQHTDDMGIVVGLIGVGGFVLAIFEPRRPWMWGVIVPAGIIVGEVWRYAYGAHHASTGGAGGLCAIAALTIAVASAGAYMGALIRRLVSPA